MVETSELVHYQTRLFDPKTLIIAVSQSGQSAEVIRLLKANRRKSPLIAITNTPDSPLARQAEAAVVTRAGKEFSVSCKTYVTTLMALKWVGDVFCGRNLREAREELKQACPAADMYLNHWKDYTEQLADRLRDIRHLFFVGRGSSLAAVEMGALIVKEADHFHAEGMSCAAFRHGPFEMLSKETFVLVFAGAKRTRDLNLRLLEDVREQCGRAELVSEDGDFEPCIFPNVPDSVTPIMEALPVQMISLALAAQSGREPGRFQLATKITTTE
jgi:glucosamine--fructose-6-phosphate aminotransferase (isomerizing)